MTLFSTLPSVTLSVIVPCYNEEATIDGTLDALDALEERLSESGIAVEVIAVDDHSTDGTLARLRARATGREGRLVVARHDVNQGKGAAIVTARSHVTGDIVLVQDADLEYDPVDVPKLIGPILDGRADAVLGTRFGGSGAKRVLYFWHRVGNGALTLLSNMFTDLNVTDMETGYKAFSREVFRVMHLTNRRFGIEPEMVARLSQMGARVYEVPISYHGRTYAEGKKITWRDGVAAIMHIVRARFSAGAQRRLSPRRFVRTPRVVEAIR
ncbi:MAG: glycosyltransferase family 2 protein [Gemmatimonadaceae bacterium]